jgi:uncharacterized protein (DUF58 family)
MQARIPEAIRLTKLPETAGFLSQTRAIDWKDWQKFWLALSGLGLALLLALEATALRESGYFGLAAASALLALVLTAAVAVRTVPDLARRTTLSRLMVKVEYELTRAGLVYLAVVAAITLAAVNTGNNLLYVVLASLLAGLLISGVVSRLALDGLEVELVLPEHVFARQPVPARVALRNGKRFLPSFAVVLSGSDAKRRRRRPPSKPDREILSEPVYWDYLPRQSSRLRHLELTFPARGRYAQHGLRLATRFPFGLLVKARVAPLQQEIVVLPAIQPTQEFYEILPLVTGEVESAAKGRGHDLYAIRDYQETDPARYVDWKATARAQQLKMREFTREDERRVVLVLDTRLAGTGAAERARFEKAVDFCACLAWHFYEIGAEMRFVTQGFETRMRRASEIIYPALECLALVEPHAGMDGDLLARIASFGPGFHIILTSRPQGSIPTAMWSTSYVVYFDSL